MNCPFCGNAMTPGILQFDGRGKMRWLPDGKKKSGTGRFWDSLGGVGNLTGAQYDLWGQGKIQSNYCPGCRKMIFDTDIEM